MGASSKATTELARRLGVGEKAVEGWRPLRPSVDCADQDAHWRAVARLMAQGYSKDEAAVVLARNDSPPAELVQAILRLARVPDEAGPPDEDANLDEGTTMVEEHLDDPIVARFHRGSRATARHDPVGQVGDLLAQLLDWGQGGAMPDREDLGDCLSGAVDEHTISVGEMLIRQAVGGKPAGSAMRQALEGASAPELVRGVRASVAIHSATEALGTAVREGKRRYWREIGATVPPMLLFAKVLRTAIGVDRVPDLCTALDLMAQLVDLSKRPDISERYHNADPRSRNTG